MPPARRPDDDSPLPTVSVVIPVKDDAAALRRCLAALHAQTVAPDEVIVVDNASSDASADIARAAGARVVRCDAPGIPAAASTGYDSASRDLILRLDADSLPGPEWVAAMRTALRRRPDVAAVTGAARFIDGPAALRTPLAAAYLVGYAAVGIAALGHLPLFGSNLAFRRRAWESVRDAVHRLDPEIHDDFDLAFHLGERHRIRFVRRTSMGISMRPLTEARTLPRRVHRGGRTVTAHWPADFPPVRWTRLLLRRMLHAARVPTPRAVRG